MALKMAPGNRAGTKTFTVYPFVPFLFSLSVPGEQEPSDGTGPLLDAHPTLAGLAWRSLMDAHCYWHWVAGTLLGCPAVCVL